MEQETREILIEPDYRHTALTEAGKLPNQTTQELLQSADKIFNWLMTEKNEKAEKRAKALEPKWKSK